MCSATITFLKEGATDENDTQRGLRRRYAERRSQTQRAERTTIPWVRNAGNVRAAGGDVPSVTSRSQSYGKATDCLGVTQMSHIVIEYDCVRWSKTIMCTLNVVVVFF